MAEAKHTPLFPAHQRLRAKITTFASWLMPLQYSGILREHQAVRRYAGLFDVSHLGRLEVAGARSYAFLQRLVTRDLSSLAPGQGCYALLCLENGGILDDVVIFRLGELRFLMVANASRTAPVLSWLQAQVRPGEEVTLANQTGETGMVALQGPQIMGQLRLHCAVIPEPFPRYAMVETEVAGCRALLSRTGYTGEDGVELIVSAREAQALWSHFLGHGVTPCGLGARNTLRLEAGFVLYDQELGEDVNPFEAGLERVVALEKGDFMGREALLRLREKVSRRLVGFEVVGQGIARSGHPILASEKVVGRVTSGSYSPTLGTSIGLGYVLLQHASPGTPLTIDIRGKLVAARVVPLPFYKRQKPL